jgi:hypothetical protein
VKKLREGVPRDQYELYISRRKAFARHLAGATTDRSSVHSNQPAVAEVSLVDAPVATPKSRCRLSSRTRAVDRALDAEAAA